MLRFGVENLGEHALCFAETALSRSDEAADESD